MFDPALTVQEYDIYAWQLLYNYDYITMHLSFADKISS